MTDTIQISKPSRWLYYWYVVGFIIGATLVYTVLPLPVWAALVAIFGIGNAIHLRSIVWGCEITGETIRIWFPLFQSRNRTLTRQEIEQVEVIRNPIRIFIHTDFMRLRLKDGKKLILPRIGTSQFQLLVDHMQESK